MPLPDAIKKSPRVYTLLQNVDLENLTADNLADVGDPIAIEEANGIRQDGDEGKLRWVVDCWWWWIRKRADQT